MKRRRRRHRDFDLRTGGKARELYDYGEPRQ